MNTIGEVLNKYSRKGMLPEPEKMESFSASGTTRANTIAEQQRRQAAELARQDAIRTAQGMDIMSEEEKLSKLQQQDKLNKLNQQTIYTKKDFQKKSANILNDLESNLNVLDTEDRLDKMEAAAVSMRLSDEKYRYQIEDIGRRKRLDDKMSRDTALKEAIFGENLDALRRTIQFDKLLDMDMAQMTEYLANIDIDSALAAASIAEKSMQETAVISGIGTIARAGAGELTKDDEEEEE